jgi:hypothetical protein
MCERLEGMLHLCEKVGADAKWMERDAMGVVFAKELRDEKGGKGNIADR